MNSQNENSARMKALLISAGICFFTIAYEKAPLILSGLSVLAVWLFSGGVYKDRNDWAGKDWVVPVLLLCALPWFGLLWSPVPREGVLFAERSYYWIFAFVAASVFKTENSLKIIIKSFLAGIISFSTLILLNSCGAVPEIYFVTHLFERGFITFSLLTVAAIILLAFFYRQTEKYRYKAAIIGLIILLAVTITQLVARSGYLALVLLSPWICVTMFGARRVIPIFISLLFIITLMFTSQKVQNRVSLISQEMERLHISSDAELLKTSTALRVVMWQEAWKIISARPLIGAGTAGFKHEANKSRPGFGFSHPHSSYFYIAANYGMIGFMLYGWLFFITLRRAWSARDQLSGYSILAFLSVILLGSLTDTQILYPGTGILLGFAVGIPTFSQERRI